MRKQYDIMDGEKLISSFDSGRDALEFFQKNLHTFTPMVKLVIKEKESFLERFFDFLIKRI